MKIVMVLALLALYVFLGIYLDNHKIITEPPAWALFGGAFGSLFTLTFSL